MRKAWAVGAMARRLPTPAKHHEQNEPLRYGHEVGLVAVNQSEQIASGYLRFPKGFWQGWPGVELRDRLVEPEEVYARHPEEMEGQGLYVRLEPYAFHLLTASR